MRWTLNCLTDRLTLASKNNFTFLHTCILQVRALSAKPKSSKSCVPDVSRNESWKNHRENFLAKNLIFPCPVLHRATDNYIEAFFRAMAIKLEQ
jgi:hypothetical protein